MALIRRVRAVWLGVAGSPYYSNFYFTNSEGDAQSYIAAVGGLFGDLAGAIRDDVAVTVEGEVPLIDSATGQIQGVASGDAVTVTGTDVVEPLPPATQLMFRLNTDAFQNGRRLAGKFYMGGLTQFVNAEGFPNSAATGGLIGALNEFVTLGTVVPVVWSRTTGAIAPITDISVMPTFAVLRSRRD